MNNEELDDVIERNEVEELGIMRERRPYKIGTRQDNLNKWDDIEFFERFRMSKETVLYILELIADNIKHRTDRNHAVSPLQQLLVALRFYACGSFQIVFGDFGGIHKTTACQIVKRVTNALVLLRPQFIKMPETHEEKMLVKEEFFKIARFPRVLGAVDCTHIRIQSLGGDEAEIFRNRKGFFSLNVQAVCDAKYKIRDIVCRWPGSSHDSYIFQNSNIRMKFENGEMDEDILLGDSGYPLRPYLITPILNPRDRAEQYFNDCQIKTRSIIERTFGILKRRFPILSLGLRNKLGTIQNIIIATVILHNIATDKNETLEENIEENDEDNFPQLNGNPNDNNARQCFIEYFRSLL